MRKAPRSSTLLLLLSLVLALVSLASSAVPLYVIRPFRYQGARELAVALFLKQAGPAISIVCALLALIVIGSLWIRRDRWRVRVAIALPALLTVAGAFLARVNIYELAFHPIDSPRFESAEKAGIDSGDMVMAIEVNGARRAYPIREMAYHHLVNDALGGEPIVATY
jgi:Protein of unknown function (DUF3179)